MPWSRRDEASVEFDAPARMRDGVVLRANVYRPPGAGPWPTLLIRTPYGKDDPEEVAWPGLDPLRATGRGFMAVVQDVRGRFASEGDWDPFRFEGEDGYDSVEWAARLPGSNGRVGLYGGSYDGNTQWLAALERPPSLAAVAPLMTWCEPLDGVFARGGAVELGLGLMWTLLMAPDYLTRLGLDDADLRARVVAALDAWDRLPEDGYRSLPVGQATLREHGVPDMGSLRTLGERSFADRCRVAGAHDRAEVPSFQTGGWHDVFLQGTLDNHQAMVALGRESRLVVGPWTHLSFADPIGELAYGIRAARAAGWDDLVFEWLGCRLAGEPEGESAGAPVRIFVMGRNEWRDEAAWPLERAVEERWHLRADGSLTAAEPGPGEGAREFAYDPADPVPTVGGNTSMWPGNPPGPRDQARVEARDDVLVYTSAPFEREYEVTGRVRVVLHAETSAPSTDWVARLCDVHPDGRSFNLCDSVLRVSGEAGECRRHVIDLWSTCNVFLPGHRLRVHVTSSSFPRWDRNLNTGNQDERRGEVARQRIHSEASRPSYVELPVVA